MTACSLPNVYTLHTQNGNRPTLMNYHFQSTGIEEVSDLRSRDYYRLFFRIEINHPFHHSIRKLCRLAGPCCRLPTSGGFLRFYFQRMAPLPPIFLILIPLQLRIITSLFPSGHCHSATDDRMRILHRTDECRRIGRAAILRSDKQRSGLCINPVFQTDTNSSGRLGTIQPSPFTSLLDGAIQV